MLLHAQSLEARRLFAVVLDDSYGDNGFVPEGSRIIEVAGRRSDGSVLFSMDYATSGSNPDGGLLVRPYRTDGSIDSSFKTSSEYDNGSSNAFTIDSKDRMVWFGDAYHYTGDYLTSGYRPTLDRFRPDGTHDDTFTKSVLPDPPAYKGRRVDLYYGYLPKVDAQDRVLVETAATYGTDGAPFDANYTRVYISRFKADGSADTGFGDNGRLLVSTSPARHPVYAQYALTPDGGIMVLRRPRDAAATLTRYTSSGRLDTSYGTGGTMTLTDDLMPKSILFSVDKQGRSVVAYLRDDKPKRVQVRRYTTSGALDTTFGSGGLTSLHDLAFRDGTVDFFTIDDGGRVVGSVDYGLFRLTADGMPDLSFAPNATINTGNVYLAQSIVTPEGIYTPAKIGKTEGTARFVETGTVTLNAKSGELSIIGTLKADSIRVRPKGSGVGVTLNDGAEAVYRNVKSLRISALRGDDSVSTSVDVPTFVGLAGGNDSFSGTGDGAYTVLGGDGNDKIATGNAADTITGGFGDDTIYANGGDDRITDLDGNSSVHGGAGNDSVRTGNGRDVLYGDDGRDTLRAAGGVDHLYGNDDDDLMFPGPGDAFFYGGGGYDRVAIDPNTFAQTYDDTTEKFL